VAPSSAAARERRTLAAAASAHILHDGDTDLLYVLLPVWQAEFGLGFAEVGLARQLYRHHGGAADSRLDAGRALWPGCGVGRRHDPVGDLFSLRWR